MGTSLYLLKLGFSFERVYEEISSASDLLITLSIPLIFGALYNRMARRINFMNLTLLIAFVVGVTLYLKFIK